MQIASNRVQKLVTFSEKLYSSATARANSLGLPFGEYIRHILIKDVEESTKNLPVIDAQTEKRIGQSLKDLAEGRYTVLKSDKDIENHFNNLNKAVSLASHK